MNPKITCPLFAKTICKGSGKDCGSVSEKNCAILQSVNTVKKQRALIITLLFLVCLLSSLTLFGCNSTAKVDMTATPPSQDVGSMESSTSVKRPANQPSTSQGTVLKSLPSGTIVVSESLR